MTPDVLVRVIEQADSWWDLVPAVVGGIIGALAGGLPAFALANRASKELDKRERKLRDEQELAKAFRLFAVLQTIVNNFFSTRSQLDEMLVRPAKEGDETPYQRRIKALVGFSDEQAVHFEANDLALLAAAKANDFLVELSRSVRPRVRATAAPAPSAPGSGARRLCPRG